MDDSRRDEQAEIPPNPIYLGLEKPAERIEDEGPIRGIIAKRWHGSAANGGTLARDR